MSKLFVGLVIVLGCYSVAVILGSLIAALIRVPVTFGSIWGILLVFVISAFAALLISDLLHGRKEQDGQDE